MCLANAGFIVVANALILVYVQLNLSCLLFISDGCGNVFRFVS